MKIKTIHCLGVFLALGVAVSCTVESDGDGHSTPDGGGGEAGDYSDTGDGGGDTVSTAGTSGSSGMTHGDGGAAGATTTPGVGGAAGDGAGGEGPTVAGTDLCAAADPGNEDRQHATPYALGGEFDGCLQVDADLDFYQYTVPATPVQGGFVLVSITDVGDTGNIGIMSQAAADNGEVISNYSVNEGQSAYHWFNAKAGSTFRLRVGHFTHADKPTPYKMKVTYTGVPDANEPNDTRQTATVLTNGVAKTGYMFAGHDKATAIADETWEDWFKVTLPAGKATVSVSDVASDINASFTLYDALGAELDSKYSVTEGSSVVLTTAALPAGDYSVKLTTFTRPKVSGDGSVVPAYLSHPYTVKVSSP